MANVRKGDFVTLSDKWRENYHLKSQTLARLIGVVRGFKRKEPHIAVVDWVGYDTLDELHVIFLRPLTVEEVELMAKLGDIVPEIKEFLDQYTIFVGVREGEEE